jgi:hypothetical protein
MWTVPYFVLLAMVVSATYEGLRRFYAAYVSIETFGGAVESAGLLPGGRARVFFGPLAVLEPVAAVRRAESLRRTAAAAGFETRDGSTFRAWREAGNVLSAAADLGMVSRDDLIDLFRPGSMPDCRILPLPGSPGSPPV